MRLKFWYYVMLLLFLYIFWAGLFPYPTLSSQLAFNFAVFYPVGMWAGYRASGQYQDAFKAAIAFNVFSYVLAFFGGVSLPSISHIILDFVSMIIIFIIGVYVGLRSTQEKKRI